MRWLGILTTTLLITALLVMMANAEPPACLISVSFNGWEQLRALAASGLQIINYQGDVLAAVAPDEQIQRLRAMGLKVDILDARPDLDRYYLAYVHPGNERVGLDGLDAWYPYAAGVYLVRAQSSQVEHAATQGVEFVKLPRSVQLGRVRSQEEKAYQSLTFSPGIRAMVDVVSPTLLFGNVCKLQDDDSQAYCNTLGTRYSYATADLNEAAQYARDSFADLGLSVSYDPFSYSGYSMNNVVAELPGLGPDSSHVLILCAHYDSTSRDPYVAAPGADDNASGSAAVLEAARILSQHRFDCTIRFVLFAGEEQGLIGSAHYAAQAAQRGDLIDGVINLDMVAYESVPPNDHIVEVHAGLDPASNALADALIANVAEYGLQLVPEKITSGATNRSDHASFWNEGYPAVLGIEDFNDFNPYYHSTSDTLANMRTQMLVEYAKACVATVAELAGERAETTPTVTLTPTQTHTPTPTSTPTATTEATETTVMLQGVSEDTHVYQYAATQNYCLQELLIVGYKQQYGGIVRFDVSSIPASATVVEASLQLYAAGWGGADITVGVYGITRTVDVCQATWSQSRAGSAWGQGGANDPVTDRRPVAESSVTTSGVLKWYAFDVRGLVQGWVSGVLQNNGVLLRAAYSTGSFRFASVENGTPSLRPKLVITYR